MSDFKNLSTWQGFVYIAFVIDVYSCRIVGWSVRQSKRTDFVLDALEQAPHSRQPERDETLIHYSDTGPQYLSISDSKCLAKTGIEPSSGSIRDSYDNALAENQHLVQSRIDPSTLAGLRGAYPAQQKLRRTIDGSLLCKQSRVALNQTASTKLGAVQYC